MQNAPAGGGVKMLRRILCGFKLFWFGIKSPDLFTERLFTVFAEMFEAAIETVNTNAPHVTHLSVGEKRIVSFWMYPGLSKNPVDRITELLEEIDVLKGLVQNQEPEIKNPSTGS